MCMHCSWLNAASLTHPREGEKDTTRIHGSQKLFLGKSGWLSANKDCMTIVWFGYRVSKLRLQQMLPQHSHTMSHLGLFWFHIIQETLHSCWIGWTGRAADSCAERSGITRQHPSWGYSRLRFLSSSSSYINFLFYWCKFVYFGQIFKILPWTL